MCKWGWIKDYWSPELPQLPDLFVQGDQEDFLVSLCPPLPSPPRCCQKQRKAIGTLAARRGRGREGWGETGLQSIGSPRGPAANGDRCPFLLISAHPTGWGQLRAQSLPGAVAFFLPAPGPEQGPFHTHIPSGVAVLPKPFPCIDLWWQL